MAMGTEYRTAEWPTSRVLAVVGGVFGIVVAGMALAGIGVAMFGIEATLLPETFSGMLAAAAAVNLILGILVFINAGLVTRNPRMHGSLLVLWGVIGMFFAFGLWFGALLVIIGGFVAVTSAPRMAPPMTRRPVA